MESLPAFLTTSLILLVLSAFFSATETAFTSISQLKLKSMASSGNKSVAKVLKLCENYDKLLSTILIGNNIVNILLSTISAVFFTSAIANSSYATAVSTIVITVVVLIFGEITPKNLAKESPEKFALFAYPVINLLILLFTPANFLFTLWKKLLLKIFKIKNDSSVTENDIITLVSEAEHEGGIDKEEGEIIKSAITFGDLEVSSVMTPRVDVVSIDCADDRSSIYNTFRTSGFSRLPVYEENIDNIIGIINLKDYYEKVMLGNEKTDSVITDAKFISQHAKIDDVLKVLQHEKSHIAVVSDDYGGTAGIVTVEDIIEELVGEIYDERDKVLPACRKTPDGKYFVRGSTEISDLPTELGIPESDYYSTIAGYIIHNAERLPDLNETLKFGDITLQITEICENRIDSVLIMKNSSDTSVCENHGN